ncbi:hypothetical protein EV652_102535 [Kribbella steppae]|uniref:PH (Pleckstrin Homology) domain-containing protein n=1 Tax=Kribbella steppae TaxID=2512223 RepID=A0A4R2HTW9_9ACTN|nr:hypothetical protein [Kribbella steppae]TCO34469.1 hypothetical protein EV652_102535 [Kribbella steppae]
MAVMGDASAEVWAEELRRTGRVVFPQRPRAFVFKAVITVWPAVMAVNASPSMLEEGGFSRVLAFFLFALFIGSAGYLVWQAITRRPVLTVDRAGIRSGRKFMPWIEIGAIGIPHGPGFLQTLPIIPANVWAKDLTLSQENVRDVLALARWLEEVLKEQRRLAVTDDLASD